MTTSRRFSLALRALTEGRTETSAAGASATEQPRPHTLSTVLARTGPVLAGALFLGVASDGLPVLLDLRDPHPGPMLIAGDAGSGKTALLKAIDGAAALTHDPGDVQFALITKDPAERRDIPVTPHHRGVYGADHSSTGELLQSLLASAHSRKNMRQSTLLLTDDLEAVASLDPQHLQHLRWLLLRGPFRRVWPIVTMVAAR